ncbi:MAG TPA: hypothetical protein VFS21_27610 [Roseiflexaceae bacterium]|nr:hypothetical protein [Roseiflexaceae bacterium]
MFEQHSLDALDGIIRSFLFPLLLLAISLFAGGCVWWRYHRRHKQPIVLPGVTIGLGLLLLLRCLSVFWNSQNGEGQAMLFYYLMFFLLPCSFVSLMLIGLVMFLFGSGRMIWTQNGAAPGWSLSEIGGFIVVLGFVCVCVLYLIFPIRLFPLS